MGLEPRDGSNQGLALTPRHRGGLGAQELPPGRGAALGCRRYPQPFRDPPHGRGSDSNAQAEHFALDPPVFPARVFRAICSISTAFSWRSTSDPASLEAVERASSTGREGLGHEDRGTG